MDSPVFRNSVKAAILFFLGVMAIAIIGRRIHTGIALVFQGAIPLLASLIVLILWRHRKNLNLRSLGALPVILTLSIIGVAGILRLIGFYQGEVPIQFTRNDMMMSSIEAMTIHTCGSLGQGDEAKPVFVTTTINSLFYDPGTDYPDLLTMLYGNTAAATMVCVVTNAFGAWFAFDLLKGVPLPWCITATLFAGWVPFARHIFGAVVYRGHMNIPVVYLVLILTRITFRTIHTIESMAWLIPIIIITLATQSPASLIPSFLLLLALLLRLSDSKAQRSTALQLVFLLFS